MGFAEDIKGLISALSGRPRARASSSELLEHEWVTLATLWSVAKRASPPPDPTEIAAIDALFPTPTRPAVAGDWRAFNAAEQLVGKYLTAAQLKAEFSTLLQLAAGRSLPSLARHRADEALFTTGGAIEDQRAAYQALLAELQSAFINGRFVRRLRGEVARRLFAYGVCVVLLALVAPLILVWPHLAPIAAVDPTLIAAGGPLILNRFSSEPLFALSLVATFGLLGAYFSRAIKFQQSLATLSFEDVQQLYADKVLLLKMLYGLIGAVLFYFIMRGGLIGGSLFPDLKNIVIGEHIVWRLGPQGPATVSPTERLQPAGLTILEPTLDMAKLLVWSFIAGFSERLVPDALARTEAQATKGGPPGG